MVGNHIILILSLLLVVEAQAECRFWGKTKTVRRLNPDILGEASGLAVSRRYNRLYHVNDSGTGPEFIWTDLKGRNPKKVQVKGFKPEDPEDLTLTRCNNGRDCILIADMGLISGIPRGRSRKLVLVKERRVFREEEPIYAQLKFRFPENESIDSEAIASHPNGDIFLMTKEFDLKEGKAFRSRIYRVPFEKWGSRDEIELEYVADLDLRTINSKREKLGPLWIHQIPTSMDISDDGKRLLVLTYTNAIEFRVDLSEENPSFDKYRRISVSHLPMQEAIAYAPDEKSFYFSSEVWKMGKASLFPALLRRVFCR